MLRAIDSEMAPSPFAPSSNTAPPTARTTEAPARTMPSLLLLAPEPPPRPVTLRLPAPVESVAEEVTPALSTPTLAPPAPSMVSAPVPPALTVRPEAMVTPC